MVHDFLPLICRRLRPPDLTAPVDPPSAVIDASLGKLSRRVYITPFPRRGRFDQTGLIPALVTMSRHFGTSS
jgi:hypothetical protein